VVTLLGADDVIALGEDDLGARVAAGRPSSRSTPSATTCGVSQPRRC